jgi:hypothetical protein
MCKFSTVVSWGNEAALGLPNLAAGSLALQASEGKADRLTSQLFAKFDNFSLAKNQQSWHLRISSTKGRPIGRIRRQIAKRATTADYKPGLL